jgi:hypothetical protein
VNLVVYASIAKSDSAGGRCSASRGSPSELVTIKHVHHQSGDANTGSVDIKSSSDFRLQSIMTVLIGDGNAPRAALHR